MDTQDESRRSHRLTRRRAIGGAGVGAATLLAGGKIALDGSSRGGEALAQSPSCVLTPAKTEGPYFVDERLDRSDIRSNSDGTGVRDGITLDLEIVVVRTDEDCAPAEGVVVDIWHADADGSYSDVAQNGTTGQDFLRGLQVTDADGAVSFRTIYPGWYSGRTIHIHFKVRTFEDDGQTYEFTSQLFFDDATNSEVVDSGDYDDRGEQDTTNNEDNIYAGDTELLVPLSGSPTAGFDGSITVGLTGLPDTGSGGSDGDDVDASLLATAIRSRANGTRVLSARVDCDEAVSARMSLTRRGRSLARETTVRLPAGRHTLTTKLDDRAAAGRARLTLRLEDSDGNAKRIRRKLRVPRG